MTAPITVVILAAGKGTHMYSDRPKVLHDLAGKPLLRHVLHSVAALGPARTIVVYGHGGAAVPDAFRDAPVAWVAQERQLGTGHALMQAMPQIDPEGTTLVLYGDVPLIAVRTLQSLLDRARGDNVVLLTVELAEPAGYGRIVRTAGGAVSRIVEHKDASEAERAIREVNTGIMALPSRHLGRWLGALGNENVQGEYYLTDLIGMAVEEGVEVVACHPAHPREVLGVNNKVQLAELERQYQQQYAHRLMERGVTLMDPARIDVRGELICGKDVVIDVNCVFEGAVHLGDHVSVGAHCVLRNSAVAEGTRIEPFSVLDQAQAGPRGRIGPFSRIRPGTVLEAEVHVGNFVELKNSRVDRGSKINHLSYVGDATVGKHVNIGAGTITCNYDGANKHRTVIGDDAFIGSDTQLVAPVAVGEGATIGAGSTITQDAPPGRLTLSRSKQVTVEGWKRPSKKAK